MRLIEWIKIENESMYIAELIDYVADKDILGNL